MQYCHEVGFGLSFNISLHGVLGYHTLNGWADEVIELTVSDKSDLILHHTRSYFMSLIRLYK